VNMPGFTAQDSLYASRRHYATGLISAWSPPGIALPALPIGGGTGGGD
jgi:hypothetical protein